MRSRFALASALGLAAVAGAAAFERRTLLPGDAALGDILVADTLDEYPMVVAQGSLLSLTLTRSGAGGYVPGLGLFDDDYGEIPVVGIGPTTVRSLQPLGSGRVRIIVAGSGGSVGGYRLKTAVQPARSFAVKGTAAAPVKELSFGAYDGFTASIAIKWKGAAPVTLKSLKAPDGTLLTSGDAPVVKGSSSTQRGFVAPAVGTYVATLEVPDGTAKWSATVAVAGSLPRGTTHDFRSPAQREPDSVYFPAPGFFPIVAVAGETGGPNDCPSSARAGNPDAAFVDDGLGTGGCARAIREGGPSPSKYLLFCNDGFFIDVSSLERYEDGPYAGEVKGFEATSVRSPRGSGSATLSGFTYDAQQRPTGWTEVRRFDATGREHELVFGDVGYFSQSGYCREFRVTHRLLPDGAPRTYDYAPFD